MKNDKALMKKFEWLGKPIKVHQIGSYKIVELLKKDFDRNRLTSKHIFHPAHKDFSYGYFSYGYSNLDEALLFCIADNLGSRPQTHVGFIINGLKGERR